MPLLTPQSSAPSRVDNVLIIGYEGSSYQVEPSHDPAKVSFTPAPSPVPSTGRPVLGLIVQNKNLKEKILILGPFLPQTLSVSSSDTSVALPGRVFSPISIPYATHDDCFAPPEQVFDQLEYESGDHEMDLDVGKIYMDDTVDLRKDDGAPSVSPPSGDLTPWVDDASEHRHTVQTRLEAVVS